MAWPRPGPAGLAEDGDAPAWRFSGRWWATPVAARRSRRPAPGSGSRWLELTTVTDDEAVVFHDGVRVIRHDGPRARHRLRVRGCRSEPCARPGGERLATFATVNDVHFGETSSAASSRASTSGPILRAEPGEPPYPETMNRAAVEEIAALGPDVVLVKGDLTTHGTTEEFEQFLAYYGDAFGDRLSYVRGNHDGYYGETFASDAPFEIKLPGVTLAVLDTAIPGSASGQVSPEQLEWLDELGQRADRPVLVFGHHHVWSPESRTRDRDLLRHQPRRLRAARRGVRPPPRPGRLLRRPHAPQPGPALRGHRRRPVGRGRLHQGLPGRVGRVPGVRGRRPPGAPAHLHARGAGVDRAHPGHVRRACTPATRSAPSPTAAL